MFIETEGTPNPATLKFLPGRYVMGTGTADFASPVSAERSPLAMALFDLPGVARVFLGGDFITVTKTEETPWQALKPQVLAAIMDHFVAGRPVIEGDSGEDLAEETAPEDAEIVAQIKESEAVFAVDYRGISVPQAAELRTKLNEAGARFRVVKNTLTQLAADKAGAESLKAVLEGPTAFTFVAPV